VHNHLITLLASCKLHVRIILPYHFSLSCLLYILVLDGGSGRQCNVDSPNRIDHAIRRQCYRIFRVPIFQSVNRAGDMDAICEILFRNAGATQKN
jgi:hypothetical protein